MGLRATTRETGRGSRSRGGRAGARRREFITLLGGAAAAWPLAARAQQGAVPVVGYLDAGEPGPNINFVSAFRRGLGQIGFVEGRNVTIEFRFAQNQYDRLPGLAADLVHRRVAVIFATGGSQPALAAKALTATIPIVFSNGADPVRVGLVPSLNRPDGNVTGFTTINAEIASKRLGFLRELVPGAVRLAILANPTNLAAAREVQAAAAPLWQQIEVLTVGTSAEIDAGFASLVQMRVEGLLVNPNPLLSNRRVQLVTLAARHAIPAIYYDRPYFRSRRADELRN